MELREYKERCRYLEEMRTLARVPSSEAPEPVKYNYHPQRMMLQGSTITNTDLHHSANNLTTEDGGEETESNMNTSNFQPTPQRV